MRALAPLLALALLGCPAATDDDDSAPPAPTPEPWPESDAREREPNDEEPQALGALPLPFVLGGQSSRCGEGGDWGDTDVDRFTFELEEDAALRITLRAAAADLDFELTTPEGRLLAERANPGAAPEVFEGALSAGVPYGLMLRCWLMDAPQWWLLFERR